MPRIAILGPDSAPFSAFIQGSCLTVGRSPENDLVLTDGLISRRHALIRQGEFNWFLEDLDSRHGTTLNGRRIRQPEVLERGDRLGLGQVVLVFEPPNEADLSHLTPGTWQTGAGDEPSFIGDSPAMAELRRLVTKFAPSDATILLQGETGTGKEVVARVIHARSSRSTGPFVVVNCPALPASLIEAELFGIKKGVATGVDPRPGLVEVADGGTLFLDEVGDLDLEAQAKMLRFLQDRLVDQVGSRQPRPVDLRVVAATHHDLPGLVKEGRFRRDLFHRLEVATIELPPLRERRGDIEALAQHFLSGLKGDSVRLSDEAMAALLACEYPGNVRELEHAIQRSVLLAEGGIVKVEDLPRSMREPAGELTQLTDGDLVDALHERILNQGESFWSAVRDPFLKRELSKDVAKAFVARVHAEGRGSLRDTASHLGLASEYRKFVDFLRHHDLRPRDDV